MSTAYAFAAVSAVIRGRLAAYLTASGVSSAVGGLTFTALPPDRVPTGAQEKNGVNIFLYRVSRNQGWATIGPPTRNAGGNPVAVLPLGADLHYVISAYGSDSFTGDILLGHVVAAFFEEPVLSRAAIRKALAPNPPDPTIPVPAAQSRLADQLELVKIALTAPSSEELSRLWASFSAPYRPSAYFDVGVVLIDPRRGFAAPLPVAGVGASTTDVNGPEIDSVSADGPPNAPIVAGSTLVVAGRGFGGDGVTVRLGAAVATPSAATEHELRVPVSAFTPTVRAGVGGLVVTRLVPLGDPPVDHQAATSDAYPVGMRPTITLAANAVTTSSTEIVDDVNVASGTIKVGVVPRVARDQHAVLLLSEVPAPADRPPRGAALPAPANNGVTGNNADTASITFAFTRLAQGTYVARLGIDGVDSALALGAGGRYDSPQVTV